MQHGTWRVMTYVASIPPPPPWQDARSQEGAECERTFYVEGGTSPEMVGETLHLYSEIQK